VWNLRLSFFGFHKKQYQWTKYWDIFRSYDIINDGHNNK
jgi:hypothetical protein